MENLNMIDVSDETLEKNARLYGSFQKTRFVGQDNHGERRDYKGPLVKDEEFKENVLIIRDITLKLLGEDCQE